MRKEEFFISKKSKPLIIQKKSKFELDIDRYKSLDEYRRICDLQNHLFDRIHESHIRQEESRAILRERIFPNGEFVFRDDLKYRNLLDYDFLVSLGGDNHFTYVAHEALQSTILGCNSDPETSVGALLGFDLHSLEDLILNGGGLAKKEDWTLIFTTIHYPSGEVVQTFPAVSEISIRNNSPDLISRYIVKMDNSVEEQKSSGLLIYTGAGSTGWVASCYPKKTGPFPKNQRYFQVYAREPRRKDKTWEHFDLIDFRVEDRFEVISEMNGGISIDSLTERNYDFPPGARAVFHMGKERLKVLVSS
jgi:NAD kinase